MIGEEGRKKNHSQRLVLSQMATIVGIEPRLNQGARSAITVLTAASQGLCQQEAGGRAWASNAALQDAGISIARPHTHPHLTYFF